jgi:hypothetical protein
MSIKVMLIVKLFVIKEAKNKLYLHFQTKYYKITISVLVQKAMKQMVIQVFC